MIFNHPRNLFEELDIESGGSSPFPPVDYVEGMWVGFPPVGYIEGMAADCRQFFQSDQQFCEGRLFQSDAFVAKGVPLSFQFLKVRRPAFFSVPQGVLTPFFQSDQQCCEGRLFFQSDQQCCEGRRASSLISSVAKSVPPSLISSVAKGVPLTLISSVAKGVPLSFSFLKVSRSKHSIVFIFEVFRPKHSIVFSLPSSFLCTSDHNIRDISTILIIIFVILVQSLSDIIFVISVQSLSGCPMKLRGLV
ncbi:unnamed protein product [Rodentolepis nana]|uniref:Uncharacterized protein n=1 Tax=Rodentolepis nana TaxID=102285 RepID=A0A0R3U0N5_RODNA|nr:unnamed protein product [Rodentolepis nana]